MPIYNKYFARSAGSVSSHIFSFHIIDEGLIDDLITTWCGIIAAEIPVAKAGASGGVERGKTEYAAHHAPADAAFAKAEPLLKRALVIGAAIGDPFYSELRTRQQLGYIVQANTFEDERQAPAGFAELAPAW